MLERLYMFAATAKIDCLKGQGGTGVVDCDTGLPGSSADGGQIHKLLEIAIGLFAIITVLMIIIAALNIIYADGDSQKVAKARSTIIYAMVGLVIAISAEIVVAFVLGKF